jgi:hypothetical protein
MNSEYTVIVSYILFMGLLSAFVGWGAPSIITGFNETAPQPPVPTGSWNPIADLVYITDNIGYLFSIMWGVSTTYPLLGILVLAYSGAFAYMMLRLIRGGG